MGEIVIKGDTAVALAKGGVGVDEVSVRIKDILAIYGARPEDFRTILFFKGKPIICGKNFRIDCDSDLGIAASKYHSLGSNSIRRVLRP